MLSDRDLYKLALENELVSPFIGENCEGATINLTLDPLIRRYKSDEPIVLGKQVTQEQYDVIDISQKEFWLQPKESVLIQTHEFIRIPNNLTGRVYERYSVKSLELMISPASYLNPGYRGQLGLVATNNNKVPIRLVPFIKICQLGLLKLSSEPLKPYEKQDGKYMDARDVSISKLHLDKEIQDFLNFKGVSKVSDKMATELGDHLMKHVRKSAKKLADILREEEAKGLNE